VLTGDAAISRWHSVIIGAAIIRCSSSRTTCRSRSAAQQTITANAVHAMDMMVVMMTVVAVAAAQDGNVTIIALVDMPTAQKCLHITCQSFNGGTTRIVRVFIVIGHGGRCRCCRRCCSCGHGDGLLMDSLVMDGSHVEFAIATE